MATKLSNPYPEKNRNAFAPEVLSNGKKPKKKRSAKTVWNRLRPLLTFVISLVVVICIVFGVFNYVKGNYFDPVDETDQTAVSVNIPEGSSLNAISEILLENDLIRNKQVFKLYVDFSDMSSKLKAGTYDLSKSMTFDDIIYTLQEGNAEAKAIDVTFIEGQSADEYGQVLIKKGILKNTNHYTELLKNGGGFMEDFSFLADVKASEDTKTEDQKRKYLLEGYLFPETYKYFTNASEEDVIEKQLKQFDKVFTTDYRERAAELGMTIDQVLTLASMIEKEAKTDQFAQVSAVFHNRLSADMTLDSDATIAYALGLKRINLTREELDTASPYNTHLNKGLPVGPICNPSKAAIEAALYPDEQFMGGDGTDPYIFFTLTDPETGELAFSHTNEEHEAIRNQWQETWEAVDAARAAEGQ